MDEIAVVGMSGRFPGAESVEEFWSNSLKGKVSILNWEAQDGVVGSAGLFAHPEEFDYQLFGITREEASIMDPQHRVFLDCALGALEDAGVSNISETLVSVTAAAAPSHYQVLLPSDRTESEAFRVMLANTPDFVSSRTSYVLGLHGSSSTLMSACSASLQAIHDAVSRLRAREVDFAIVGGVYLEPDQDVGYRFEQGMIYSPSGRCAPYDRSANGTVNGYGGGVVVLQRLDEAERERRNVHAVIRGSSVSNDGTLRSGFAAPGSYGQALAIAGALIDADVSARDVGYLEGHGTGTPLGDPIELEAAGLAYRSHTTDVQYCALGSAKANIGHLGRAAGIAGFIRAVCAVRDGLIPPQASFDEALPELELEHSPFYIPRRQEVWANEQRISGVSSFGMGGTNAHVILQNHLRKDSSEERADDGHQLWALPISGADGDRLVDEAKVARESLTNQESRAASIIRTFGAGRRHDSFRSVLVGNRASLREQLTKFDAAHAQMAATGVPEDLVFAFSGQAGRSRGDIGKLINKYTVFRADLEESASILGMSTEQLVNRLQDIQGNPYQPAHVAIQHALFKLFESFNVTAQFMIGSSLGEYSAALCAGVWEKETILPLLAYRDELMRRSNPGFLMAIHGSEADALEVTRSCGLAVTIAAMNAEDLIVIGGPAEEEAAASSTARRRGLRADTLPGRIAFHTPLIGESAHRFGEKLACAAAVPSNMEAVSTLTGDPEGVLRWHEAEYWVEQMLSPIRVREAYKWLAASRFNCQLELGTGTVMSGLARRSWDVPAVSSGGPSEDLEQSVLQAAGAMWSQGFELFWDEVNGCDDATFARLPRRRRHDVPIWRHSKVDDNKYDYRGAEASVERWRPVTLTMRGKLADPIAIETGESPSQKEQARALGEHLLESGYEVLSSSESGTARTVIDVRTMHRLEHEEAETQDSEGFLGEMGRSLSRVAGSLRRQKMLERYVILNLKGSALRNGNGVPNANQVGTIGAIRALAHERPGVSAVWIDIEGTDLAAACRTPLESGDIKSLLASRDDLVVKEGIAFRASQERIGQSRLRHWMHSKAIIIIGGFSRISQFLTKDILDQSQAVITMTARPRDQHRVEEWMSERSAEGWDTQRIQWWLGDIEHPDEMQRLLVETAQRHHRIDGVYHLVGNTAHQTWPLLDSTHSDAEIEEIYASKVRIALNLRRAAQQLPEGNRPRTCVLYSSMSVVVGGLGYAAYIAGNAALDSCARAWNGEAGIVWTSIRWDNWEGSTDRMQLALVPGEAIDALSDALGSGSPICNIVAGDVATRIDGVRKGLSVASAVENAEITNLSPADDVHGYVMGVVADVTGVSLAPDKAFASVGIDSLQMMQIESRVRKGLDMRVGMGRLARTRTLMELIEEVAIGYGAGGDDESDPVVGGELSSLQERLWYLWQLEAESDAYNIQFGWSCDSTFSVQEVRIAVEELFARHAALRTRIRTLEDGRAVRVADCQVDTLVQVVNGDTSNDEIVKEFLSRPFDLEHSSARVLVQSRTDGVTAYWSVHHMSIDSWSIEILRSEFNTILAGGRLAVQSGIEYDTFVNQEKNDLARSGAGSEQYWRENLRKVARPRFQSDREAVTCELRSQLSQELMERVRSTVVANETTMFTVLFAAATATWLRQQSTTNAVVGTNFANRLGSGMDSAVGAYVTQLPVVVEKTWLCQDGWPAYLTKVEASLKDSMSHRLPFDRIVRTAGASGSGARNPLWELIVTASDIPTTEEGGDAQPVELPIVKRPKFDLSIEFLIGRGGVGIHFIGASDLFSSVRLAELSSSFEDALAEITDCIAAGDRL